MTKEAAISIVIRTLRAFVQALLSGAGLSSAGVVLNIDMMKHLQPREILILAAATAGVVCLQNTLELLAQLDQKYPLIRG